MKKKIAVDVGYLESGHSVRGVGVYATELISELVKINDGNLEVFGVNFNKEDLSKYDLIHYPYFHPFFLTLPARKQCSKVLLTVHDLIPLIYPAHYPSGVKGKLKFLEQKRRLSRVDAIITVSETSKKDICRFLNVKPNVVQVVYLAPKAIFKKLKTGNWEQEIRNRYGLPKEFVLYVGDVNYNKNISTLLFAAKIAKIPIVIVGKNAMKIEEMAQSNHPENQHLADIVADVNNKDVIRTGFVPDEDLVKIYNLASVYCQASYYEGFGLGILEAQACGTPVVASKTQVHVEISEGSCLFADPDNANEMAGKISQVVKDKALSSELVRKGKANAAKFSWKKTARETLDVYNDLLKK